MVPDLQWFECPCHGSQYKPSREKKAAPLRAVRPFVVSVDGGNVMVDTKQSSRGPRSHQHHGQEAEGPHCVGGRE